MVEGVNNGYSKALEIVGVGSRAQVKGTTLVVSAGYSHPVEVPAPAGITFKVENNTRVIVSGIDKELVGNEAAKVRANPSSRALQGQGHQIRGRAHPAKGRQVRQEITLFQTFLPFTHHVETLPQTTDAEAPSAPPSSHHPAQPTVRGWLCFAPTTTSTPS